MNISNLKDAFVELSSIAYVNYKSINLPKAGYQIIIDTVDDEFIAYSLVKGTDNVFSHVVVQLSFRKASVLYVKDLPCSITMYENKSCDFKYRSDSQSSTINVGYNDKNNYQKLHYPIQEEEYFQKLTQIDLPEEEIIDAFMEVGHSATNDVFLCFQYHVCTDELTPEEIQESFEYLLTKKGDFQKA